jgi:hypothetical protein
MIGAGAHSAYEASRVPLESLRAGLADLAPHELEARRNELHVCLAAVNDELQRRGATRNARIAAQQQAARDVTNAATQPLDPSDPSS